MSQWPKECPVFLYVSERGYKEVVVGTLWGWSNGYRGGDFLKMNYGGKLKCADLNGVPCHIPYEFLRPLTPAAAEMLATARGSRE